MSVRVVDPVRVGTEQLAGGQRLGWAEWGPADGVPVLLSPGAATSRHLGFGGDVADGLGVRVISLDRPGLGASSPRPGRTFGDFADDIRAFAALRDLGRPLMVGNSQGAPFALACAAAGVVGALAVVSGADEIAAPCFDDALPGELRRLVDLAVSDPAAAEKLFAGFTPQAMWDMVMSGSPECDLAVYRQPAFAAAYRRALDEAFAQGADGYAKDTVLAMGHWGIELSDIDVPVDLWYGEKDTGHSPDQGAGLTSRIPGAVRHLVPDAGGAVLWTHAEQVLCTLLGRAAGR
ncbi:alpha/beta fold hydrolase [Streptomyces atratus]|uniref:alpha/beta fold hydrolase n=1 Tax=Streptomyces atratus TaxID=1893 RepID=UPI00224D02AF|nr:alpha/beta hydrolase [Streptomyces atratus]MCX5343592.1 alpha/beta hydrolase [Streptomyces atratus]